MPKVDVEALKKKTEEQPRGLYKSEINGTAVFYHTDYPGDYYDNPKDALENAQHLNGLKRLKEAGLDENGQPLRTDPKPEVKPEPEEQAPEEQPETPAEKPKKEKKNAGSKHKRD